MTNDWTDGYVADHTYGHYYFSALAPGYIRACLLMSGFDLPVRESGEPLRYLELGYGQGFSLNLHAAANQDIEFWGTDFLPDQALNAQYFALLSGLGTHILNDSFAELDEKAQAGKLPLFDIIVFHGIWSWINHENQQHILNIVQNSLKPNGAVYISYNSQPGRSLSMPIRELMSIHADRKGIGKDSVTRATEAAALVRALSEAGAAFFTDSPAYTAFVERMQKHPATYLAHEYLNKNWHASYFFEIAKTMATVGCNFVTSANILESTLIAQPEKTRSFLNAVSDPVSWEVLKDYNQNTSFRRDIFIRDSSPMTVDEWRHRLDQSSWCLAGPLDQIKELAIKLPYITLALDEAVYRPILNALAENSYAPKTLAFLRTHPNISHLPHEDFFSCMRMLFGCGYIAPAQPSPSEKTLSICHHLNNIICHMTANGNIQQHLVSPVLGCAYAVSEPHQLFLRSYIAGETNPAKWGIAAFTIMHTGSRAPAYQSREEAEKIRELFLQEAQQFAENTLPFLRAIGIVPASRAAVRTNRDKAKRR